MEQQGWILVDKGSKLLSRILGRSESKRRTNKSHEYHTGVRCFMEEMVCMGNQENSEDVHNHGKFFLHPSNGQLG